MHLPKCRLVRRWVLRGLDALVEGCFLAGVSCLAWRDALEPPALPPEDLTTKVLARIRAECPAFNPFHPSQSDQKAAAVADAYEKSVYVLPGPHFVLDCGQPGDYWRTRAS